MEQAVNRLMVYCAVLHCFALVSAAFAEPGIRFDQLQPNQQERIRTICTPPPLAHRVGPYSTPMYYLMHKGYEHKGDDDLSPDGRCYGKLAGIRGIDWGNWKLDRNRPDWQEAMVKDWAELGLNSTHFNIYPVKGQLTLDPDWATSVRDFVALSEKYGIKVGVRLDAIDETKLWTVHPNNPDSQRAAYLKWVEHIVGLLVGKTTYYVLGDELTLRQPGPDLPKDAWTAEMYLQYFGEVSRTIKNTDPQARVCMFSASSGEWFNVVWMLEHGYAEVGDGVAINHYDYHSAPKFFADRDRLAPGKLFLTSGVGYISNGTVQARYPEGDSYSAAPSEQDHAAEVAKTMFMWWDLGADTAPYYISLRNWNIEGRNYPRWFGFFGFEDYVVRDGCLTVKRYPAWYAYQAISHTFFNRQQMRAPAFAVTSDKPIEQLRCFERELPEGSEVLLMIWDDHPQEKIAIKLETDTYRYPVKVSLSDVHHWDALDSEVQEGSTTLKLAVGPEPTIIRLVRCDKP